MGGEPYCEIGDGNGNVTRRQFAGGVESVVVSAIFESHCVFLLGVAAELARAMEPSDRRQLAAMLSKME